MSKPIERPMTEDEIEMWLDLDEVMRRYEQRPEPPEEIPGVSLNGKPLTTDKCDQWSSNDEFGSQE